MQHQIRLLKDIIDSIDKDHNGSLSYFTGAPTSGGVNNKQYSGIRYHLIQDALHRIEHGIQRTDDCNIVDNKIPQILSMLNEKYQHNQHLCWKSHEHHFHSTFESYINCPITCLCEIGEYLDKLMKEIYHT